MDLNFEFYIMFTVTKYSSFDYLELLEMEKRFSACKPYKNNWQAHRSQYADPLSKINFTLVRLTKQDPKT